MFISQETPTTNQLIYLSRSNSSGALNARSQLLFRHERILTKLVNHAALCLGIRISKRELSMIERDVDEREQKELDVDERYEDLQQISRLALLEALQSFDINRGVKFSTYLWHFVKGRLNDYMAQEFGYSSHLSLPVLDSNTSDDDIDDGDVYGFPHLGSMDDAYTDLEYYQTQAQVGHFLSNLKPRQRDAIYQLYWQGMTQTQLAHEWKVSTSMVHKVLGQVKNEGHRYFVTNPFV